MKGWIGRTPHTLEFEELDGFHTMFDKLERMLLICAATMELVFGISRRRKYHRSEKNVICNDMQMHLYFLMICKVRTFYGPNNKFSDIDKQMKSTPDVHR